MTTQNRYKFGRKNVCILYLIAKSLTTLISIFFPSYYKYLLSSLCCLSINYFVELFGGNANVSAIGVGNIELLLATMPTLILYRELSTNTGPFI